MSRRSPRRTSGEASEPSPAHPLVAGAWLAAVAGVLLLGALLRGAPAEPGVVVDAAATASSFAPAAQSRPDLTTPPPPAPQPREDLALRAETDLDRLLGPGDGWTAQLAVLCDRTRVQGLLERHASLEPFHVVPTYLKDDACFLVCWNRYSSADRARAAADLPSALRAIQPRPLPKRISEIEKALE